MKKTHVVLTDADRIFLERHAIDGEEVMRQWAVLTKPRQRVVLDRACTVGDGIESLETIDHDARIEAHRRSSLQGRWLKFVPASGAASRMFSLPDNEGRRQFAQSIDRFAFSGKLREILADRGEVLSDWVDAGRYEELLDVVVDADGLGLDAMPKGLVEFHQYQKGTRTPFEEHLWEARACLRDRGDNVRAHFTVAPGQQLRFEDRLRRLNAAQSAGRYDVEFSEQQPSTDTIGIDAQGRLLRDPDGQLVVRPGGHGALIENLNDLRGDLIFVKNIDNVCHERMREPSLHWIQVLGGHIVRLQQAAHDHLRGLKSGHDRSIGAAREFVSQTFFDEQVPSTDDPKILRVALIDQLCRPLRVCGMVRNEGEPGGGPFWVRHADGGVSTQIVEESEVDTSDREQRALFQQATHFNPVFMALGVGDDRGEPFDLKQFVDDRRAIVTHKPVNGQAATVFERPGLWNGAMAGWNTVFVEVPKQVFSPVKSVLDLLRSDHQPVSEPVAVTT